MHNPQKLGCKGFRRNSTWTCERLRAVRSPGRQRLSPTVIPASEAVRGLRVVVRLRFGAHWNNWLVLELVSARAVSYPELRISLGAGVLLLYVFDF